MTPSEYEEAVSRTKLEAPEFIPTPRQVMIIWNALGLAGEAGEVNDHIKKGIFHEQGIDKLKIKKELGDTLWYLTAICIDLADLFQDNTFTLESVMIANDQKLRARYPNGFNAEDSTNREGEAQ